eukprot:sb/3478590/
MGRLELFTIQLRPLYSSDLSPMPFQLCPGITLHTAGLAVHLSILLPLYLSLSLSHPPTLCTTHYVFTAVQYHTTWGNFGGGPALKKANGTLILVDGVF